MLQKYLKDKYGENYEKQAQTDYENSKSRINTGNALSNLAEAFGQAAGKSRVGDSDAYFQGLNKQAKEDTIGKIAADKNQFVKDQIDSFNMQDMADKSKIRADENDLNNPMLKNYKEQMAKFGVVVPEGMTLAQAKRDLGEAKTLNELKMKSTIDNQNKIQLMLMEQKFKEKEKALDREAKKGSAKIEGFSALDKDYAKDYNDWTTSGMSTLEKNLKSLEEARDALKTDPSLTGGTTGMFNDRVTADRVLKQRQKVNSAIQGGMKATLGTAFTEKEGERVLKNAYNEAASPETNLGSLDAAIADLRAKGKANEAKARYFEKNGTLNGFQAPVSNVIQSEKQSNGGKTIVKTQTNVKTGQKKIIYSDGSEEIINSLAGGN